MSEVRYAIVGRGCGKSHRMVAELQKIVDNNEKVVFMTKSGLVDLETLKNYKFDDAPDHLRYVAEYLGRFEND